jgi:hypothetical protein
MIAGSKSVWVTGPAGVGKTRCILEALNEAGLREIALYHRDAESPEGPEHLIWHIRERGRGRAVFVIDECGELSTVEKLRDSAQGLPDGFFVILVGTIELPVAKSGGMTLSPMRAEEIDKILEDFLPVSPRRAQVATLCGGYPKLAVLIGKAILRSFNQDLSIDQLLRDRDLVAYLKSQWGAHGLETDQSLLAGLSLLTRVGWRDDRASDGLAICEMMEIQPGRAQASLARLIDRGIIAVSGRFVYVTPTILAIRESASLLSIWDKTHVQELYKRLTPQGQIAFVDRLRQCGSEPDFEQKVQAVIETSFFFHDLVEFDQSGTSQLFRVLLPAFPNVLLDRLETILLHAERESLVVNKSSRRDLVWALEELAWWPEHFARCSSLLLVLACAENEEYSNNASGVWENLFKVFLAGTAAPYDLRLPLLVETVESKDAVARRLAARALAMALETGTITGSAGPTSVIGRPVPSHWQPKTYGEWKNILVALVPLLIALIRDSDESVRREGCDVAEQRLDDLINAGLDDLVAEVVEAIGDSDFELSVRVIEVLDRRIERSEDIGEDRQNRLADLRLRLSGHTLLERVMELTQSWENGYRIESKPRLQKTLADLTKEVSSNPEVLSSLLPWLCGGKANSAFILGMKLGEHESAESTCETLFRLWDSSFSDSRFYLGLFQGLFVSRGLQWIQDALDRLAQDAKTGSLAAFGTWQTDGTDRGAVRLQQLVRGGSIKPGFVRHLPVGFWARDVSNGALNSLLGLIMSLRDEEGIVGCLDILGQICSSKPDRIGQLEDLCLRFLEASTRISLRNMDEYAWASIAKALVGRQPTRLAATILAFLHSREPVHSRDDFSELLALSIKAGGETVFLEVIGPAIDREPELLWRMGNRIAGKNLLDAISPGLIIAWIERSPETRLEIFSHAATVPDKPAESLARELLVRWGDKPEVLSSLAATFQSGSWWGPESAWMRRKLASLQIWKQDPDTRVRSWAAGVAAAMRVRLPRAETTDQERELE